MDLQLFCTKAGRSVKGLRFMDSELGELQQSIPFEKLARLFPSRSPLGSKPFFDVKGMLALQVLKAHLGLSDDMLRQRLNTDWALQMFCFVNLSTSEIKDKDMVGRCRRWLAENIDYEACQKVLVKDWLPFIHQKAAVVMDATCYEVKMRFPSDIKLLYEACQWIWYLIDHWNLLLNERKVRRKDKEVYTAYRHVAKMKRKTKSKRRAINRRLLNLLRKGLDTWADMKKTHGQTIILSEKEMNKKELIEEVYLQQCIRFLNPDEKIENRIVSLSQPWIRPIIRGKETKLVEFGAKVHTFMVDGISFVEYFSFDAFHEGKRLEDTIKQAEKYFGKCRMLSADRIYAMNVNRRYCSSRGMITTFPPKGPKVKLSKEKKQIKAVLNSARANQLEGSFGNEKNHYGLNRVVAKREDTQKLMIYFGIWTASAMKIRRRRKKQMENIAA